MTKKQATNESMNPDLEKLIMEAKSKLLHSLIIQDGVVINPEYVNRYIHILDGSYYFLSSGDSEQLATSKIIYLFTWYRYYVSPKSQRTYTTDERISKDNEISTIMQNVILQLPTHDCGQ